MKAAEREPLAGVFPGERRRAPLSNGLRQGIQIAAYMLASGKCFAISPNCGEELDYERERSCYIGRIPAGVAITTPQCPLTAALPP